MSPATDLLGRDREARRAAQTVFDRPVVLEAGAGTGKTTTLERLLLDAARDVLQDESNRVPLLLPLADYRDYPYVTFFLPSFRKVYCIYVNIYLKVVYNLSVEA